MEIFSILLLAVIICLYLLTAKYMDYCYNKGLKMFANPRYEERINELENKIKGLEKEK